MTSLGFRHSCGEGLPSIITKVSHYLDWIEEKVWPDEFKEFSNLKNTQENQTKMKPDLTKVLIFDRFSS